MINYSKRNFATRILRWIGCTLSFLLILVLLTTWLINREPFQSKIRLAISERTDNLLTFERLRIALLPLPRLILSNAKIAIPGSISGSVQTAVIRPEFLQLLQANVLIANVSLEFPDFVVKLSEKADNDDMKDPAADFKETRAEIEAVMNMVREAAPRFRGEVRGGKLSIVRNGNAISELSDINARAALEARGFSIRMDADTVKWGRISANGAFLVTKRGFSAADVSVSGGRSSISGLSARISLQKRPYLQIISGQAEIALEDVYDRRALFISLRNRLRDVKTMKGTVKFTEINFRGPLLRPERWKLKAAGKLESLVFDTAFFTRQATIESGIFTATEKSIKLTDVRGSFLDSSLSASANIAVSAENVHSVDLWLNGVVRAGTMRWINDTFGPSPWLSLRAPLKLADLSIGWKKGSLLSLKGRAAITNGPALSIDLDLSPGELLLKRLTIEDGKIDASLALTSNGNVLDVKFKGSLNEKTMNSIFESPPGKLGWIKGDMQARLRFDRPGESIATGTLEGADFNLPYNVPIFIQHLNVSAQRRVLNLNSGLFEWADMRVNVKGSVTASDKGFDLDLDAGTGSLDMDKLRQMPASEKSENESAAQKSTLGKIPLSGVIRFHASDFAYGRYNLKPFRTDILFGPEVVRLKLISATLCGVALGGTIRPFGPEVQFDLVPVAAPQQLEPVLQCFEQQNTRIITGEFDMNGFIGARAASGRLLQSLHGHVELSARNGKIHRAPLLSRIFAFLNVTELLRGKLPDLGRDGFAYKSIRIKGDIIGGKLMLKEAYMEGATLNLAAEGEIDIAANTIDVTVLVAPFKTIEFILSKIPIIKNILANRLITVPVRVKGDLNNPEVTALAPTAIGKNLLDIMNGIVEIPFKVLDPLFRTEKKS